MSHVNATTFTIVVILFLFVTFIGFAAAHWRRADDMMHLNEWGLGGRWRAAGTGEAKPRERSGK